MTSPDSGEAATDPVDLKPVTLLRNARFQLLWSGQAMSTLGAAVADVAYPLAILAVTGSPGDAGLFGSVQAVGTLLAGIPAGYLADRFDLRRVVVLTEGGRALITGCAATALAAGWFSLPVILAVAALLGLGQPITGASRLLLIRSVVAPSQLTAALTQDEVRTNGSALAGPPMGGALYGMRALAHVIPFLFTAGSFTVSLATAAFVPSEPRRAPNAEHAQRQRAGSLLDGVATLRQNKLVRSALLLIAMVNTLLDGLTLAVLVILRDQHLSSSLIGLVLAASAVGGLVGATLVKPLHRLRPGVLLVVVCLVDVPVIALLPLPFGPWWVAGLLFVSSLGAPSVRVLLDILILRQVAPEVRGQTVGIMMTVMGLGTPIGLGITGLMLQEFSARSSLSAMAALLAVVTTLCAARTKLVQARWPS